MNPHQISILVLIACAAGAGTASYAQLDSYGQDTKFMDLPEQFHCKNPTVFNLVKAGLFCESRDQDQRAIGFYDQALKIDPHCVDALFYRGNAHSSIDEYQKAIADYTTAAAITPVPAIYMHRALTYSANNDVKKAIADATQVLKMKPHEVSALQFRAKCYGKLHMSAAAIKDQSECIAMHPKAPFFYYTRATSYKAANQYEKAVEDYTTIIKLMPDEEEAFARRAECEALLGKYYVAIGDLTKVIQLDPKGARPYLLERAEVYDRVNKHSLAIQDRSAASHIQGHEGFLP